MKASPIRFVTQAAAIAALYVALTALSAALGLDKGAIQIRLGEVLTVLPVFTAAAIPGVSVGCLLSSILFAAAPYDILFGSLATLLAAILTWLLRRAPRVFPLLSPVLVNTAVIPFVVSACYGSEMALPILAVTVCAGEIISAGVGGFFLYGYFHRHPRLLN